MELTLKGYCRVSTREQNEERQVIAMLEFGVPKSNIIIEKTSGKDFDRPKYKRLVGELNPGDVLVIKSLDRLGRDYEAILDQWRYITKILGATIVVLDMPLLATKEEEYDLTRAFIADLVLQILSYIAEIERKNIHIRQAEGIAAAKARGVRFGPKAIAMPENFRSVVFQWERKEMSFSDALKCTNLSEATFYRRLREYRTDKAGKAEV